MNYLQKQMQKKALHVFVFSFFMMISTVCCAQENCLSRIVVEQHNPSVLRQAPPCGGFDENGEGMIIDALIKNGDVVFDVGANVGKWSKRVLSKVSPQLIYAFEPIPKVYETCSHSLASPSIFVENCAVSSVDDNDVAFYAYPHHWNGVLSSLYQRVLAERKLNMAPTKITVKTRTLDSFCREKEVAHIDFLKIDTEGAEYDVLCGARGLLGEQAIDIIQFEYGLTYKDSEKTLKSVVRLLSHFGYVLFKIYPDKIVHVKKWEEFLEVYDQSNYVALGSWLTKDYEIIGW